MSAQDNLNPRQFFHGTSSQLNPGDVVAPAEVTGREATWSQSNPKYAYATSNEMYAMGWAHQSAARTGNPMRVYVVSPVDATDVTRDRTPGAAAAVKSRSGFTVVNEKSYGREKSQE